MHPLGSRKENSLYNFFSHRFQEYSISAFSGQKTAHPTAWSWDSEERTETGTGGLCAL